MRCIGVAPEALAVTFMDADTTGRQRDFAIIGTNGDIEQRSVGRNGLARGQFTRAMAQSILALIDGITPGPRLFRASVGHEHLGNAGAVENGPFPTAVDITHLMEDQSIVRIE